MPRAIIFLFLFSGSLALRTDAQTLSLKDAVNTALANYGSIKAKSRYVDAAKANLEQSRRDYAPNLVISAQQDYGTVNGQNGPLYGFGGFGVASSGLPLAEQNWNAAFGALYLANFNWDFFTFGRSRERIKIAKTSVAQNESDLVQEQFQHQVRVAAAYLNLLAAQRITYAQQRNLDRAVIFRNTAAARASNGLIPGVDSSQANAEVSNAKISLTKAVDMEQEQANKLAVLLGMPPADFVLDSTFVKQIPASIYKEALSKGEEHPVLKFYQSRINLSNEQTKYFRRLYYPTFTMFGIIQGRGSGFSAGYTQDQTAFTRNYGQGVNPTRGNYLVGIGMNWNLSTILRNSQQVRSQKLITEGMQEEYALADQQLKAQIALAETKIANAMANYSEVGIQVRAASDAYQQKSALYKNGLATVVDVTQTLYALNRAETDRDITYNNVWQALLMKAAATGDLSIFMNEF